MKSTTFTDWANQAVPARVFYNAVEHDWICEINPYGDAWHEFGWGLSVKDALSHAQAEWNQFDQNR